MVVLKEMIFTRPALAKLGALTFSTSVFKDELRTPHFEMDQVEEMIERDSGVYSGLSDFARFVFGTKLIIKSKDPNTKLWVESWFNKRKRLKNEVKNNLLLGLGCGNSYFQPLYVNTKRHGRVFDNAISIPDSSRVYINLNQKEEEYKTGENYWIYRVPDYAKQYLFNNKMYNVQRWPTSYVLGSKVHQIFIFGIGLNEDELVMYKNGWSRDGIYGRGLLNSAIDNNDIKQEILKNLAIIARNRALNTKFIQIGGEDAETFVDQNEIDNLQYDLAQRAEGDHVIINKPIKTFDMDSQGKYDSMQQELEFIQKDMVSPMLPMYLTPWGSDVNRANAEQTKIPFGLKLDSERESYIDYLHEVFVKPLLKSFPHLSDDLEIDLGAVDLDSMEEKMRYLPDLFRNNIISINEVRERLGFDKIPGGGEFATDVADTLRFGVEATGSMKEALESDKKDSVWKSRLVNKRNMERSETSKMSVLKKKDLRGQIVRLVENKKQEQLQIWNGLFLLKDFAFDEQRSAEMFYQDTIEKITKSFEQFFEGKTEADILGDELFKELKREYADILTKFFRELDNTSTKKENVNKKGEVLLEAFVGQKMFDKLDGIFAKFNNKVNSLIDRIKKKALETVIQPEEAEVSFGVAPDKKVDDSIKDKFDLLMSTKMSNQIKTFNTKAAQDIQRMLADASASGQSVSEVKQEIKDKYVNWKRKDAPWDKNLNRIVRTEMSGNLNLLKLKRWEDMGFEEYQWHSMEDEKVRPTHAQKNKKIFKIKDALSGKAIYPGGSVGNSAPNAPNINCRCFPSLYS